MTGTPQEYKKQQTVRGSRSLFGAVVLIATGIYFLLYNLNQLPPVNWDAVWPLWPLLLIFLGLNVLVTQIRRPWGSLFSLLVALGAVAVFSLAAFSGESQDLLRRAGMPPLPEPDVRLEEVAYPVDGVQAATISFDLDRFPASITALSDSSQLVAGQVAVSGNLAFETSVEEGQATISLDTTMPPTFLFSAPDMVAETDRWQLGLSPDVPLDLAVDVSSGAAVLELSRLNLTDLSLDGGSGALVAVLPDGDYELDYDAASGASELTLPQQGTQRVAIDGASGALLLRVPRGRAVRLELDGGSGGVSLPPGLFERVSGREAGEGVWATPGYDQTAEQLLLQIDQGSGRLLVEARDPGGR
jgi:hypothetical protein